MSTHATVSNLASQIRRAVFDLKLPIYRHTLPNADRQVVLLAAPPKKMLEAAKIASALTETIKPNVLALDSHVGRGRLLEVVAHTRRVHNIAIPVATLANDQFYGKFEVQQPAIGLEKTSSPERQRTLTNLRVVYIFSEKLGKPLKGVDGKYVSIANAQEDFQEFLQAYEQLQYIFTLPNFKALDREIKGDDVSDEATNNLVIPIDVVHRIKEIFRGYYFEHFLYRRHVDWVERLAQHIPTNHVAILFTLTEHCLVSKYDPMIVQDHPTVGRSLESVGIGSLLIDPGMFDPRFWTEQAVTAGYRQSIGLAEH